MRRFFWDRWQLLYPDVTNVRTLSLNAAVLAKLIFGGRLQTTSERYYVQVRDVVVDLLVTTAQGDPTAYPPDLHYWETSAREEINSVYAEMRRWYQGYRSEVRQQLLIHRPWTAEDIQGLIEHFPTTPNQQLVWILRRTRTEIEAQAQELRLRKNPRPPKVPVQPPPKPVKLSSWEKSKRRRTNRTVNEYSLDRHNLYTAYVIGFIWATGKVRRRPRVKLRLSVPQENRFRLERVLQLIHSKHTIYADYHRWAVDICCTRLVEGIERNWGKIPEILNRDVPPPQMDRCLLPYFVQGVLHGSNIDINTDALQARAPARTAAFLAKLFSGRLKVKLRLKKGGDYHTLHAARRETTKIQWWLDRYPTPLEWY